MCIAIHSWCSKECPRNDPPPPKKNIVNEICYLSFHLQLKAYGRPCSTLSWLSDLYISFSHLLGRLCGYSLATSPHTPSVEEETHVGDKKKRQRESLVNSKIWKTLFRGGCMVGKLTHSISGAYVSGYNHLDS